MSDDKKNCLQCKNEFIISNDDQAYYDKINVDQPRFCPLCRSQQRLLFRNERSFYKRPCDKCKKEVISMYSPNKPDIVWCHECWFKDDWDGTNYAQEYDFSKPFFDQLQELWL